MERIAEFQKVSYKQFLWDCTRNHDFEKYYCHYDLKYIWEKIQLPIRSTSGSAGYDFFSPFTFSLAPRQTIVFPLGIRCKIKEGWFLGMFPRSSLGFKYRLQIDNTIGVIDSDYYYSDNEGNINISLTNDSTDESKICYINERDRIAQGIFLPYGITWNDETRGKRTGGIGSTGK